MLARVMLSRVCPHLRLLAPMRSFRDNPYSPTILPVTEEERKADNEKPVWERRFDFRKYMVHKGTLKVNPFLIK